LWGEQIKINKKNRRGRELCEGKKIGYGIGRGYFRKAKKVGGRFAKKSRLVMKELEYWIKKRCGNLREKKEEEGKGAA